jgi:hypothetical protein
MFDAKLDSRVRDMLKANGFRWSPAGGFWHRRQVAGFADFLSALDRVIEPGKPDGPCWKCGAPGRYRPHGAAAPVYCDDCHKVNPPPPFPDQFDRDYEDRCREACGL